jgi:hypothetical protein
MLVKMERRKTWENIRKKNKLIRVNKKIREI